MNKNKLNTPSELVVTACLSAGLSILLALINIVLCVLALIYRFECLMGDLTNRDGAEYFLVTILRTYILKDDCTTSFPLDDLTKADSIFILAIIILVFAVVNFITAVALISVVGREAAKNVDIIAYIHIGVCVACLVVDLTIGVHFGMDYKTLSDYLMSNSAGLAINYERDTIRFGALLLMTVSLKGYIAHAINLVLLILLMCYVVKYQRNVKENEHPIHKLGVLNAFDPPKRLEDPWHAQRNDVFSGYPRGSSLHHPHDDEPHHKQMRENRIPHENSNPLKRLEDPWHSHRNDNLYMAYPRGPQVNPAFNNEEEPIRAPVRENPLSDYNSRNAKRSDSWLHNQMAAGPGLGSRPFSYLEEPKRPIPVKPPTTPSNEPQWRRDPWPPAPPVPDPDYSPPPRRLKSALKSNYP